MKNLRDFLFEQNACLFDYRGLSIAVLDNPKPALTALENKEFIDGLIDNLQVLTAESFGVELEDKTSDGVRNHVVNVDSLALLHNQDEILGFASSQIFREDGIFYLHGVAISQHSKSNGSGTALTRTLMNKAGLSRIAFTTQNPIMFCLLRSLCSIVYPCPELALIPEDLQNLGTKLVSGRSGKFDSTSFVVSQLYGRCLYNVVPDCKDPSINQWFKETLTIESGLTRDGFLFIGNRKL